MFLEHQIKIRMISEGSCDTEDWSNDAKNYSFYCIFLFNQCNLGENKMLFLIDPKPLNRSVFE